MRKKKGHATEAKGWNFFEFLRRIGFVLIGIMTLVSEIGVSDPSFGAEVVFVNAPRESWRKLHAIRKGEILSLGILGKRLELYKAYVEIRPVTQFIIKAGRQRLDYGDFRTFGLCNWTNTGPYLWDAVKLSYDFGKNNFIDAFYGRIKINAPKSFSLNHRHSYDGVGVYSTFSLPILNAHIEPFFAYKGDGTDKYREEKGGVGTLNEYYAGARLWGRDFYNFDYDLWSSKEFGRRGSDDIDAYAYYVLGGYNFKGLWAKPRLSLEYTYSSGDDDPDDGDHETFDVGYGVWGAWYGNQWDFSQLLSA